MRLWMLALLLGAFLFGACSTTSGGGTALVASVTIQDPGSPPSLLLRYDGDTLVLIASATASAEVFQKASASMPNGAPIIGPLEKVAGKTLVRSRSRDETIELDAGAPLPAWVLAAGLFRPAELEALGITFAAPTVIP